MALTVTTQPAETLILMRSPILCVLRESVTLTREDPTFRYVVDVRAWVGTIASVPVASLVRLLRVPGPEGNGLFNIAPVLEDLFSPSAPFAEVTSNPAGTWNCELAYGYLLDGVYTEVSRSDVFQITDGYAVQQQNLNQYEKYDEILDVEAFLSPVTESYIVDNLQSWLHVYRQPDLVRFIDYEDDQGNRFSYNFPSPQPPTASQFSVLRLPLAPADIADLPGSSSFSPVNFFNVIVRSAGILYEEHRVNILNRNFCDLDVDAIAYINRYGVWDYIHFRGRVSTGVSQERTNYLRRITSYFENQLVYAKGTSEEGSIGVKGTKQLTLQTGFVPESVNEKIQDLLMSKYHYSFKLQQNVKLDTSSIDFQQKSNEDLINYTMQFSLAGNLIQSIE